MITFPKNVLIGSSNEEKIDLYLCASENIAKHEAALHIRIMKAEMWILATERQITDAKNSGNPVLASSLIGKVNEKWHKQRVLVIEHESLKKQRKALYRNIDRLSAAIEAKESN